MKRTLLLAAGLFWLLAAQLSGQTKVNGYWLMPEISPPSNPPSSWAGVYVNGDGNLCVKTSDGGGRCLGEAVPGGDSGAVQFNNEGALTGESAYFFWDTTAKMLKVNGTGVGGVIKSGYRQVSTAGAIMQAVSSAGTNNSRAVFGHNAWWDETNQLWRIGIIGNNDANVFLFGNNGSLRLIRHGSTGVFERSMSHSDFLAGTQLTVTTSGDLKVGPNSESYDGRIVSIRSHSNTTGGYHGAYTHLVQNSASGTSTYNYGLRSALALTPPNGVTYNAQDFNHAAVYANPRIGGAGSIAAIDGVLSAIWLQDSSNASIFRAFSARTPERVSGTSTITKAVGLHIQSMKMDSVTEGWGIEQTGANDKNYFAGDTGIGTNSPTTKLDVDGIVRARSGFRVSATPMSGHYLRSNGSEFVESSIQASDLPDLSGTYQPKDSDLTAIAGLSCSAGQIIKRDSGGNWVCGEDVSGGPPSWGSITGTLSNQTDLQAALDAKASTTHQHSAGDITSGILPTSRGGLGSTSWTAGSLPYFNGTSFVEENTRLFWESVSKQLRIDGDIKVGGATANTMDGRIAAYRDHSNASGAYHGIYSILRHVSAGTSITYNYAVRGGLNMFPSSGGYIHAADYNHAAVYGHLHIGGAGGVAAVEGLHSAASFQDTVSVGTYRAFSAHTPVQTSGTPTVTKAVGLHIQGMKTSFITSSYGIEQRGADDINYFEGNTGVGVDPPTTKLDVNGIVRARNGFRISASPEAGTYLRSNGSEFVESSIQASDLPDLSGTYQPADADLTAIAALSCTTGQIIKRNASGQWGCADESGGSSTPTINPAYIQDFDEWTSNGNGATQPVGRLGWTVSTDNGSGAAAAGYESYSSYSLIGVAELAPAGVNARVTLHLGAYGMGARWFATAINSWEYQFVVRTDNYENTQVSYIVGLADSVSQQPTNGIWVRYRNNTGCTVTGSDTGWVHETRSSGTSTTQASGMSVSTATVYRIRIRKSGSGVGFSMCSGGPTCTLGSETVITTNIPTADLVPYIQSVSCASGYRKLIADRFDVLMQR